MRGRGECVDSLVDLWETAAAAARLLGEVGWQ